MSRVGIITFLHNGNYGSLLQAWALQQALRELGHEPKHLDYCPDTAAKVKNLLGSGNSPSLVLEGIRKRSVSLPGKSEALARFRKERMALTAPCRNPGELKKAAAEFDVLLSGSDQIWSPVWLDPAYFLDFASNGRKLAYAPSLGISVMPDRRKAKTIARMVKEYEAVSVRESQGAALLKQMAGVEAPVLPDPVFLLTEEKWRGLCQPAEERLVCYFIGDSPRYWDTVRIEAERTGLRPLIIPVTDASLHTEHEVLRDLSPESWLSALAGAGQVVTDSFHGAAFAAIFRKKTTLLRRWEDGDPASKNSRIDQLRSSLERENALEEMRARGLGWLREHV